MTEKKKPFWEVSYKRPGKLDTFGRGKPSEAVVRIASMMPAGTRTLDMACGEGRNALYLANQGFLTSAFDVSKSGIEKLALTASERNLEIDMSVCDMREYVFPYEFDLIVCEGCLHLITRDDWIILINRMKISTTSGGYHITGVFTDAVPEPEDQRGLMVGLFKEGELLEQYQDWEIVESQSFRFSHNHPGGISHEHAGNEIIARKPK